MKFPQHITSLVLLLTLPLINLSQDLRKHEIKSYTVEDGLPSSETYKVIQDQEGYLWIASEYGLSKYDGNDFTLFNQGDGLLSQSIFHIFFEKDSSIVGVGSSSDLFKIKHDSVSILIEPDTIEKYFSRTHFPYSYFEDSEGNHHIGTRKGYYCFDQESRLKNADTMENDTYKSIVVKTNYTDNNQHQLFNYWIPSTLHGASVLIQPVEHGSFNPKLFKPILPHGISIYGATDDHYAFIPYHNQLFVWNKKQKHLAEYQFKEQLLSVFYRNQNLYLTTRKAGVLCYTIKNDSLQFDYQILNGFSVSSMTQSSNGQFWFTTLEDGLKMIDPQSPVCIYQSNENIMRFLFQKDSLLVGFENGELDLDNQNGIYKLANGRVYDITPWQGNTLVAQNYIYTINQNGLASRFEPGSLTDSSNYALQFHQPDDSTLIWNNGYGFNFFNPFTKKPLNYLPMKMKYEMITPIISFDGNYITSFSKCIYIFKKKNPHHFYSIPVEHSIICFFQYKEHLFGFTTKGKLFQLIGDHLNFFLTPELKDLNRILDAKFHNNTLHFSTNLGVFSCTLDTTVNEIKLLSYLKTSPVNQLAINGDTLLMATRKSIYKKDLHKTSLTVPNIHFKTISVNNKQVEKRAIYTLSYEENNIAIQMNSIAFRHPVIYYKYKLIGRDKVFLYSKDGSFNYSDLNPGNYDLQVAATSNGLTYSPIQAIHFSIAHPFWQTWWFIMGIILLALIIISRIWIYRVRRIRKNAKLESTISNLRSLALAGQLNPHLIFNVLNSIQGKVSQGEHEKANIYIAQFSAYLRNALNHMQVSSIPIADELKMIRLYFELEQIRFENNVKLNIMSEITSMDTLVPPLVLQPLIENAIKYGASTADNLIGKIDILLTETDTHLLITVSDNGSGFDTNTNFGDGLRITTERLKVLSPSNGLEVTQQRNPTKIQLKIKK